MIREMTIPGCNDSNVQRQRPRWQNHRHSRLKSASRDGGLAGWAAACWFLLAISSQAGAQHVVDQPKDAAPARPSAATADPAADSQDPPAGSQDPPVGSLPQSGLKPTSLADADELLLKGSYDEAREAFTLLSNNPADAVRARVGIAACQRRQGEYEEALLTLTRSPAADSMHWHNAMATVLRTLGRYAEAMDHARDSIKIDGRGSKARRILAECLYLVGRRDQAIEAYRWFDRQIVEQGDLPRDADWITNTAIGFLRFSELTQTNLQQRTAHVLNQMLQVAYGRVDRLWWPARIASAELLRARHNNDDVDGSVADYDAALRINPNLCEAFVGLGQVALENWAFEIIEQQVAKTLEVNPHYPPAFHLEAWKLIVERRYQQARESCEKALAINSHDLIALSISAAAASSQYDSEHLEQMRRRVAEVNPRFAEFHQIVGNALAGVRQFPQAESYLLRAIELEPADANARTELGRVYMEWGREALAREMLEGAWTLDPFNQRTKFTLDLLDSLEKFARHETAHFIIRFDKDKDPGLGIVAADYLESIYQEVVEDFDAEVKEKTIIELFPTQKSFGVRITGKPWIHTVGACTGRVIALASPRKSPGLMGPYHMGRVLRHEFTHTVTLAATTNRIPHWFTEGLAVMEEDSPRSFDWAEMLADSVRRDELFSLESIDWGFMRPKRPTDRHRAYAQSEWMCEFIVQRFGYDRILKMLAGFREGKTQAEVIERDFGWDQAGFDVAFAKWARKDALAWCFDLEPPGDVAKLRELAESKPAGGSDGDDPAALGKLARAEFDSGGYEQAIDLARRALELNLKDRNAAITFASWLDLLPSESGHSSGSTVDPDDVSTLQRIAVVHPDIWIVQKVLGGIMLDREEWDGAVQTLKQLQRLCPLEPSSWRGLAGVYMRQGRDDFALPQLIELAQFEQRDDSVPAEIARLQVKAGRLQEGKYWYRQALMINPFGVTTQERLADLYLRLDETGAALGVYALLTRIDPTNAAHFTDAALAAKKLGDGDQAKQWAAQAVQLDPESPAASLLD